MKRSVIVVLIAVTFVILWVVWYLGSPLFLDKSVNEDANFGEVKELFSGEFQDADSFHKVSGKVIVLEDGGKRYLRFENFESTNGPDLKVYLSVDDSAGDYVSLGELKGNIGNQNYEISEGSDLEKYDKVLIWCERFSVLFGSAELN